MSIRSIVVRVVLLLSSTLVVPSYAAEILFIGAADPPNGGDPFVLEHLEELGHNVTYQLGLETEGAEAEAFDLLIMSSTNLTSDIRESEFDLISKPILTWESSMVRDVPGEFYMTDDQQSGDLGTDIAVVDGSHPILAGLGVNDGDEIEMFTEPQNFFGLTGEIAAGANLIATGIEDDLLDERIMIVEMPAGGEVLFPEDSEFDGGISPGPRVFIPLSDTSFEFLTDAGLQIFDNALHFALGGPSDPCDFDKDGALDVGDIDLLSAAIQAGTNDPTFDLNADGMVNATDLSEFVTSSTKLNSWIGDANLDGEFNSSDFVQVFTSGKFETGAVASWTEGDWNGDGRFDSSDFVAAFTDGGFELGPRVPQARSVPEPSGIFSVLILFFALAVRIRVNRQ